MVEFALILALVALVVIVALLLTGAQVMNLLEHHRHDVQLPRGVLAV